VPPLRGLRTRKTGQNVRRHDLHGSNASMIKQKKPLPPPRPSQWPTGCVPGYAPAITRGANSLIFPDSVINDYMPTWVGARRRGRCVRAPIPDRFTLRIHWRAEALLPLSGIGEEEPTALTGVVGWLSAVGEGMVPSGW